MSIHHKIQKLLNLAERAGTEAEANAAMSAAHLLLAKHSLSMGDVKAATDEPIEDVELDQSIPAPLRNAQWQSTIYTGIAHLYFCKMFTRSKRVYNPNGNNTYAKTFCIVGKPGNVAVVKYIAAMLINTCEAEAKRLAKQEAQRMADEGVTLNTRAWSASFKIGFASRIHRRAVDMVKESMAGTIKDETGTALVLAPAYNQEGRDVKAFMSSQGIHLTSSRSSASVRSSSGYEAGQSSGNIANLRSNGVGHSAARQISG